MILKDQHKQLGEQKYRRRSLRTVDFACRNGRRAVLSHSELGDFRPIGSQRMSDVVMQIASPQQETSTVNMY